MVGAPGAAVSLPPWRARRILYDDEGILVVDKPPGIPVYGGDESLAHGVTDRLAELFSSRGRDLRLSLHQRLDQDTSGVLFFVTDERRNAEFSAAMERHEIRRRYVAIVGPPAGKREVASELRDEGRVEVWLAHRKGLSTVTSGRPKGAGGAAKRAVTHYRVLRREGERALVELTLETGRTHQIRATMAHLGFPVVGDRIYGGAGASRLMLHAASIEGRPLPGCLSAPVPEVFEMALRGREEFPEGAREALEDAATLRFPLTRNTSAYRLVNGAGDGLPGLTIDVYGRFAVLNVYDADLLVRLDELCSAVASLGFSGVYVKRRVRADLRAQSTEELAPRGPHLGEPAPESYLVDEFGMQIHVELDDGLSTGLFVDMRDNRFRARSWARGGKMLNLFCYTCSFSVAAALSGAITTNVDLSAKALARGRANFEANGLEPSAHRFFKEDAMKYLSRAARRAELYDFIVLDPPSFATVGKGTFSVKNEYGQAVAACLRLLGPGGRLLCVTNHQKTSTGALVKTIRAAADEIGVRLSGIKQLPRGLDVPDGPEGPFPSKSVLVEVG